MRKAYSYIRFSTPEQAKGRSQARQLEDCETYCRQNNLQLAQEEEYIFLDKGRSAFKAEHLGEHGQLARFLRLVKDGTIPRGSYLIVESLDRLSREHVKQALPRFMDLLNDGINIVTLTDGRVYTSDFTDADLIMSIFVMSRAHEESSTKAKRLRDAWRKKQESARELNRPIGKSAPLWLNYSQESGYQVNEARAAIVRRVFALAISGHGAAAIAKILNQEGVPAFKSEVLKKGSTWGSSAVGNLLSNRAVIGIYQPYTRTEGNKRLPSGNPIEGYFPAVVDMETFYAARSAVETRRTTKVTRQTKNVNVWQKIAKCGCCASPMHIVQKGETKGGKYLVCYNSRKGLCDAKVVRLDQSEIAFREILLKLDSLALVRDSERKIEKDLSEVDGRLMEARRRVAEYTGYMLETPSKALRQAIQKFENEVEELEKIHAELLTRLSANKIVDRDDFLSKLDFQSREARAQINALMMRLKVRVFMRVWNFDGDVGTSYVVYQGDVCQLRLVQKNKEILIIPLNLEQIEKVRTQDLSSTSSRDSRRERLEYVVNHMERHIHLFTAISDWLRERGQEEGSEVLDKSKSYFAKDLLAKKE